MSKASDSGRFKTMYDNGNYLLLFGKRKLQRFENSSE